MNTKRAVTAALALGAIAAAPAARANEVVMVCDTYGNHVAASGAGTAGIRAGTRCPGEPLRPPPSTGGMAIWPVPRKTVMKGKEARWILMPPSGLIIDTVNVAHMYSYGI